MKVIIKSFNKNRMVEKFENLAYWLKFVCELKKVFKKVVKLSLE